MAIKKITAVIIIMLICAIRGNFALAEDNLAQKLAGRILLQVEQKGEAWYVNPIDQKKYYLGRPADALKLMQKMGIGISDNDLEKIPFSFIALDNNDEDKDGLSAAFENAIGTDPKKNDTDGDGYNDYAEIANGFDPLTAGKPPFDLAFAKSNLGKIFLQIEKNGEAWYVDPVSEKRYFLGRPDDAFALMRKFGLGISNENINKIPLGYYNVAPTSTDPIVCDNCRANDPDSTMSGAASAIRANDKSEAVNYFIPEMKKAIEYTMDFLDADGRLTLGNILSGAELKASTENKKTYSTEVYFSLGGYKVPINFYVEKQADGKWLLTNL